MLDVFYTPFAQAVEQARGDMPEVIMGNNPTGELCEKCGGAMIFKYGRHGLFTACSAYPDCRNSKPILVPTGARCPECGGELVERRTRRGRLFYGCAAYAADDEASCRFRQWKRPLPQPCPACGGLLNEIQGRQAQCHQCEQTLSQDTLLPPTKPVETKDKPKPAIVYMPAQT